MGEKKKKDKILTAFPNITFPNIFRPFMAARAAAACMCSKNSTKQYGSFPAVWERGGKKEKERKAQARNLPQTSAKEILHPAVISTFTLKNTVFAFVFNDAR